MDKIIEVKNLSFEYEEGSKTIDNISFDIEKGTYTTILGHNGSGKSTISKLLMGLLEKIRRYYCWRYSTYRGDFIRSS